MTNSHRTLVLLGIFVSNFSQKNSAFHYELFVGAAVKKRAAVAMSSARGTV